MSIYHQLKDNPEAQVDHYLVPPSTTKMLDEVLSDTKLKQIESYVMKRAKVLAQEKHQEMDELLNDIIYQQMKKIRAQSLFIKHFEGVYKLQGEEIATMKEECLAERISITKIKTSANNGGGNSAVASFDKVFEENEFAESHIYELANLSQDAAAATAHQLQ